MIWLLLFLALSLLLTLPLWTASGRKLELEQCRFCEWLSWTLWAIQGYRTCVKERNRAWSIAQSGLPRDLSAWRAELLWRMTDAYEFLLVRKRWAVAMGRLTPAQYRAMADYLGSEFARYAR